MLQFLHNVKKYLIQEFVASYFNYTFFMIVLTFGNLITYITPHLQKIKKLGRLLNLFSREELAKVCWDDGTKSVVSINMLHSIDNDFG